MAEPVALAALALEAAIGWPTWLYARIGHPVGGFARLIALCERCWNRADQPDIKRRAFGVVTVLLLLSAGGGAGLVVEAIAARSSFGWLVLVAAAFPGLAQRSLYLHVRPVAAALAGGDLPAARTAVGYIVGRDTARLDAPGVARAAIESLAESFCDGIVAPLFWLLVGGLPGLWAYKAINTADSLIGHREPRWRAFGWAAARTDDLLNLVPARVSGLLLCVAGGRGWRTLWRDAGKHASPNAGWPEAAMAGALGLRLAGPITYDGVVADKPWIGDGRATADAADIQRALALYVRACGLLWLIAGGVAWLR
ncbi:adenosylcobinamide-phosphate synthase CbiB [Sphingomonas sp. TDK1]|uniref:adenosylcobinamide-phosphate synthase CbiB n=1 Tax=Sphingomonas sp. TDK1 TaxID=453247 RepID=UPI0007D90AD1|nr:adenosylcobinamide-phosphate synthase CbiB [Sphingomonas sp. TDK1]OAN60158.1 cobalamin biosynthesis protein CobD [Sphingomonas sp. TDK1]